MTDESPFRRVVDDLTGGDGCMCHTGVGYNTSCQHCRPAAASRAERPTGKCGCNCRCHDPEYRPGWPGPCAACCEPGMNCDCGRALMSRLSGAERPIDPEWLAAQIESYIEPSVDADPTYLQGKHIGLRLAAGIVRQFAIPATDAEGEETP